MTWLVASEQFATKSNRHRQFCGSSLDGCTCLLCGTLGAFSDAGHRNLCSQSSPWAGRSASLLLSWRTFRNCLKFTIVCHCLLLSTTCISKDCENWLAVCLRTISKLPSNKVTASLDSGMHAQKGAWGRTRKSYIKKLTVTHLSAMVIDDAFLGEIFDY